MKKLQLGFCWSLVLLLLACNPSSDNTSADNDDGKIKVTVETEDGKKSTYEADTPKNMDEAMDQVENMLQDLGGDKKVEPVNFRELQKLLKENMAGMERVSKEGQSTGALGFKISTAEAEYEGNGQTIEVNIIDTGGLGVATMAVAAWTNTEIDREDRNGFERTTKIDGHLAYEKYDKQNRRGELALFVGERFVVSLSGRELDNLKPLYKFIKAIGMRKLERMG